MSALFTPNISASLQKLADVFYSAAHELSLYSRHANTPLPLELTSLFSISEGH